MYERQPKDVSLVLWHVAEMPQSQYAFREHGLCMNTALSTSLRDVFSTKQMPTESTSSLDDRDGSLLLQKEMTDKSICDVSHALNSKKETVCLSGTVVADDDIALNMQYNIATTAVTEHQWRT